jgi:hypothetical protein
VALPDAVLSGIPFVLRGEASSPAGIARIAVTADGALAADRALQSAASVKLEDLNISIIFEGEGRHNLSVAVYEAGTTGKVLRKSFVVTVKGRWGDPPAVSLLLPKEVPARRPIPLKGTVRDDNGIRAIEVFLDGRRVGGCEVDGRASLDLEELGITVTVPRPGKYRLLVRAVDSAQGEPRHCTDREVDLKALSPLGSPPVIKLMMGKEQVEGREFPIAGTVTDTEGVRRISCFLDGKRVLEKEFDSVPLVRLEEIPWRLTISEPGSHVILVRAFDDPDAGMEHSTDAQIALKVKKGVRTVPDILIVPPSQAREGVSFLLQGSIRYDSGITGFDVFLEGMKVTEKRFSTETTVSLEDFCIELTPDSPGRKVILVKAYGTDEKGATVTSEKSVAFNAGKAVRPKSAGITLDIPSKVPARSSFIVKGTILDAEGIHRIVLLVDGKTVTERDGLGKNEVDLESFKLDIVPPAPGDYEITVRSYRKGDTKSPAYMERKARFKATPDWGKAPWMIVYPPNRILAGQECIFTGRAKDDTGIVAVIIYVDGKEALRKELNYEKELDFESLGLSVIIPGQGTHRIRFRVLDCAAGREHGSEVAFNVQVESALGSVPKVSLTVPDTVRAGRTFRLGGRVSDDTGVNRLQIFMDGRLVVDRAIEPCRDLELEDLKIDLDAPPVGKHELRVRAYDEYPTRFERFTDAVRRLTVIE